MSEVARATSTSITILESHLLQVLTELCARYRKLSFASSLGMEDMVLTDFIARHQLPIDIFTLDTGRLPEETYSLLALATEHYAPLKIRVIAPEAQMIESLVTSIGINGFYKSLEARKACCAARKIEPLKRALAGAQAWITGLRQEQSEARTAITFQMADPLTGLDKYNPLLAWTHEDVQAYLNHYRVPVNALHAQGYPSLGCAPCTRAVQPNEHPRAGRWWWEAPEAAGQECGLHVNEEGQLVRSRSATLTTSVPTSAPLAAHTAPATT
jgi:phosphoadenosine phosphosulfate reductase